MTVTTHEQAAKTALTMGLVAWMGLTALAVAVGAAIAGKPGVWAAVIGSGIAGVFFLLTAAVAVTTSAMNPAYLGGAILGSWLIKIMVLMAVLAWLRNEDFYHRGMLFGTLVITTFGMLILESILVTRAKVPYVQPQ
jgi:hypothetical protein